MMRHSFTIAAAAAAALVALAPLPAQAAKPRYAQLAPAEGAQPLPPELTELDEKMAILPSQDPPEQRKSNWTISVRGTRKVVKGKTLGDVTVEGVKAKPDPKTGEWEATLPYFSGVTQFLKIGVDGKEGAYRVELLDPEWGLWGGGKGFEGRIGWGASSFSQNRKADSSEMGVYARASYSYKLPVRRLRALVEGFVTALPFNSSREETARYYGLSVAASYHLPLGLSPWTLDLGVGYAMSGMLVTNDEFGFTKMNGLLLNPVVTRELESGAEVSLGMRFAGAAPRAVGAQQFAVSAIYRHPMQNSFATHWLGGLDFQSFGFEDKFGIAVYTTAITVTGGVGF